MNACVVQSYLYNVTLLLYVSVCPISLLWELVAGFYITEVNLISHCAGGENVDFAMTRHKAGFGQRAKNGLTKIRPFVFLTIIKY